MYLNPLFFLVLAWMVDGRAIPGGLFRVSKPLFNAYVFLAFLALAAPLLLRAVNISYQLHTRRGTLTIPATDTVVDYVQDHVAPGEEILVYPSLPLYYYPTETPQSDALRYFQPGMNTPQQAQEMIAQLEL